MYADTHYTAPGRMESRVNFSRVEGHPIIQPLTRPGIELGTSGLGGRDLNHCTNLSTYIGMQPNPLDDIQAWDGREDTALPYTGLGTSKRVNYPK